MRNHVLWRRALLFAIEGAAPGRKAVDASFYCEFPDSQLIDREGSREAIVKQGL